MICKCAWHRRRMETAAKARIVLFVCWSRIYSIPCPAYYVHILTRSIWKNSMNSTFYSKSTEAKQKFCLPNRYDDLCLFFCLHPSSMVPEDSWSMLKQNFTDLLPPQNACILFKSLLGILYSV